MTCVRSKKIKMPEQSLGLIAQTMRKAGYMIAAAPIAHQAVPIEVYSKPLYEKASSTL
jgi:hypothetical protein